MARALKVFSTPAGFVTAVVAAPSQKAALEAWGVRENLFASGAAKVVDDPALIARALASPGEIVRVPISTDAELIAAATPPPAAGRSATQQSRSKPKATSRGASMPKIEPPEPPPDRGPLTRAEIGPRGGPTSTCTGNGRARR